MADRRHKSRQWIVADERGDLYPSVKDGAMLAVLLDIRDELEKLNLLLHCRNFTGMPRDLRQINARLQKLVKLPGGRPKRT